MPATKLETSNQIIKYILSLSDFIEYVKIIEVHKGHFTFAVKVPLWYKFFFGRMLRKSIEKNLKERMFSGVSFEFTLHHKTF